MYPTHHPPTNLPPTNHQHPTHPTHTPPRHQALDPKVHIAKLLASKRYEDGFYAALNSSSLEVLMWACRQVDASVLSSGPQGTSVLSQTVLLSLLHQLASELRTDTALKLEWLAEVVPLINARDPLIAAHIKGVATAVMAALKELIAGLPTTDPLAKQAKPVLHLLNPLMFD
jgi:enhancer of mRNA-decapping protein 4